MKKRGTKSWLSEIPNAIFQISSQMPSASLDSWVFFDPFLRFLHAIGRQNAALLTSLRFTGYVLANEPKDDPMQDLVFALRIYIVLIEELCPKVKRLILRADIAPRNEGDLESYERRLTEVLRDDLRRLEGLRELVVERKLLKGETCAPGDALHDECKPVDFAKETVDWVRERGRREWE